MEDAGLTVLPPENRNLTSVANVCVWEREVSALVPHLYAEHRDGWRGVTRTGCRCPHLPHTGQPSA